MKTFSTLVALAAVVSADISADTWTSAMDNIMVTSPSCTTWEDCDAFMCCGLIYSEDDEEFIKLCMDDGSDGTFQWTYGFETTTAPDGHCFDGASKLALGAAAIAVVASLV